MRALSAYDEASMPAFTQNARGSYNIKMVWKPTLPIRPKNAQREQSDGNVRNKYLEKSERTINAWW